MANKFKVGDKVRYADPKPASWESSDWCKEAGLRLGAIYTVSGHGGGPTAITLVENGGLFVFEGRRFKPAEQKQVLTAEDGTRHNAVALSAILAIIDNEAEERAIAGKPRLALARVRSRILEQFGHTEGSDET